MGSGDDGIMQARSETPPSKGRKRSLFAPLRNSDITPRKDRRRQPAVKPGSSSFGIQNTRRRMMGKGKIHFLKDAKRISSRIQQTPHAVRQFQSSRVSREVRNTVTTITGIRMNSSFLRFITSVMRAAKKNAAK